MNDISEAEKLLQEVLKLAEGKCLHRRDIPKVTTLNSWTLGDRSPNYGTPFAKPECQHQWGHVVFVREEQNEQGKHGTYVKCLKCDAIADRGPMYTADRLNQQ